MKKSIIPILALVVLFSCGSKNTASQTETVEEKTVVENTPSIYDFKMKSINGEEIDFAKYKGKKILIVNTASKCGNTPQYEGLQKLHEEYKDKLHILGFPANNFKAQEPGTDEEIAEFCKLNYGVTFQMFSKISVKGDDKHPLYQWLTDADLNGWNSEEPNWNFSKYLVSEDGKLVKYFNAKTKPYDEQIISNLN